MTNKILNKKQIKKNLRSGKEDIILETINYLKDKGNSQIIPDLIELLRTVQNQKIQDEIADFLANIKNKDAIPLIIEAIQNERYKKEISILVSSCWQSSLDFSKYLPVFIDIFISEQFQTAFEAFTVIENLEGKFTKKDIDIEIDKLKSSITSISDDKRELLVELTHILKNFETVALD